MKAYFTRFVLPVALASLAMSVSKAAPGMPASNAETWQSISNRWSVVPFNEVEEKATAGDVTAQYFVSAAYDCGIGVKSNRVEAFKWTELAAKQGMPRAERRLGWMLQNGKGAPMDLAAGAGWYRSAAEHGDAPAQNGLGCCYQKGMGVDRDPKEALVWYLKAAPQGESLAQKNLARLYASGSYGPNKGFGQGAEAQILSGGVAPDHALAEQWMRAAVDMNSAQGQWEFGNLLMSESNTNGFQDKTRFAEAGEYFKKAAEQGHAKAQYQLAMLYHAGKLGEKLRSNCIPWFQKSADQGNADAQSTLARLSEFYPKSELLKTVSPVDLLLKSAEKENVNAQFELATRYQNGDGVAKSEDEAFKWMQRAAKNEACSSLVSKARFRLGVMYETGYGGPTDAAKARELYRQGVFASFTDPSAAFRVAQMYETGEDLSQDDESAVEWYYRALIGAGGKFRSEAIESLFRLYADGRGFRKASPGDSNSTLYDMPALIKDIDGLIASPRAQLYVGEIFSRGQITPRDDVEAVAWIRVASSNGLADAQKLAEELDAHLSAEQKESVRQRSAYLQQKISRTAVAVRNGTSQSVRAGG
jgi:TPR repeat protein